MRHCFTFSVTSCSVTSSYQLEPCASLMLVHWLSVNLVNHCSGHHPSLWFLPCLQHPQQQQQQQPQTRLWNLNPSQQRQQQCPAPPDPPHQQYLQQHAASIDSMHHQHCNQPILDVSGKSGSWTQAVHRLPSLHISTVVASPDKHLAPVQSISCSTRSCATSRALLDDGFVAGG